MNKQVLKSYFVNSIKKEELKENCFSYKDSYLISNGYSIVKLNKNYGMNISVDKLSLNKIYEDFEYNFNLHTLDITQDIVNCQLNEYVFVKEYSGDIKEENEIVRYGVDIKRLNKIRKLIKANVINIKTKYSGNYMYVIELVNTKTSEKAYLLPIRVF